MDLGFACFVFHSTIYSFIAQLLTLETWHFIIWRFI